MNAASRCGSAVVRWGPVVLAGAEPALRVLFGIPAALLLAARVARLGVLLRIALDLLAARVARLPKVLGRIRRALLALFPPMRGLLGFGGVIPAVVPGWAPLPPF